MDTFLQNHAHSTDNDLESDIQILSEMASAFQNMEDHSENGMMLRHFGNEIASVNIRLQDKLQSARNDISTIKTLMPNGCKAQHALNEVMQSLKCEIQTNRAENSLRSSLEQKIKTRIGNQDSPATALWSVSLNEANGKVQSALRSFVNTIESFAGEFTDPLMQISSSITNFDTSQSQDTLKRLASWNDKLYEFNPDNLKAAETAIALTAYALGDQHSHVSNEVIMKIQEKHFEYLKE